MHVLPVQAICFAYLNLLLFRRSRCPRRRRDRCLSFLLAMVDGHCFNFIISEQYSFIVLILVTTETEQYISTFKPK